MPKKRQVTQTIMEIRSSVEGHPLQASEDYVVEIYDEGFMIRERKSVFGPFLSWDDVAAILKRGLQEGVPSQKALPLFEKSSDRQQG